MEQFVELVEASFFIPGHVVPQTENQAEIEKGIPV